MTTDDLQRRYERASAGTRVLQACPDLLRGRSEATALKLLGRPSYRDEGGYRSWNIGVPDDLQSDWPPFQLRLSGGRVVAGSGWGLPEVR